MKAMQFQGYGSGGRWGVAEIPPPEPRAGQLLVEVAATSINPIDWKLRSGLMAWGPRWLYPSVPCLDVAGTVAAVGPGVDGYRIGDRVFGMLPVRATGAAAEFTALDQRLVARLPAGLDFQEAAGMPLAGLTALQGLRDDGRLQSGQRLLVIGASGGVGHFAVQIGKALGAHVTGVCSTRNVALVKELGADQVIDYGAGIPAETLLPFDLIFDAVVSRPFHEWRPLLGSEGIYVTLLPGVDRLWNALSLRINSKRRIRFTFAKPDGIDMSYLASLAGAGKLRTRVDAVYPLERLDDALQKSRSRRVRGKIIVLVRGSESAGSFGGTSE